MNVPKLHLVRDNEASQTVRPTSFADYIGQEDVVAVLREAITAAKRGGWQLDHILMTGPAGLGKTSLAGVVANELGAKVVATAATAIEHKGAMSALLTSLKEGDILFIDEIHALDPKIGEVLYTAMEDRKLHMSAGKRVITVDLPNFTLIGATTHAGKLSKPLTDRFGITCQLRPYTLKEMTQILVQSADRLGLKIDQGGASVLAKASRGTPRLGNKLLRRVRDFVTGQQAGNTLVPISGVVVGDSLALVALDRLKIDALGLGTLEREYLRLVAEGPMGVEAICVAMGEDRSTIENNVELTLVQLGLVKRTGKGRVATEAGKRHLEETSS